MSSFLNWFAETVVQKMENRLKLYKVEVPNTSERYKMCTNDIESFIVACFSEEEARNINPHKDYIYPQQWVQMDMRHLLLVRLIGYADSDVQHGEILMEIVVD